MTPLAGVYQRNGLLKRHLLRIAAVLVALLLHMAIAAPFIWSHKVDSPPPAPPALEIAMFAMAPQAAEETVDEAEPEPEPELEIEPELPEEPAEVVLEKKPEPPQPKKKPEPKPEPKPAEQPKDDTQSEQQVAQQGAIESEREAAPVAGMGQKVADAERMWQQELRHHLDRRKRYPRQAQRMRQEGTPVVRFKLDGNGNVVQADLETGSGVVALDREAVMLVKRAQPLPPPPAELTSKNGGMVDVTLPIEFSLVGGRT